MSIANKYFYLKQDEKIKGPFSAKKLLEMTKHNVVSQMDLLSSDKVNWRPLGEVLFKNFKPTTDTIHMNSNASNAIVLTRSNMSEVVKNEETPQYYEEDNYNSLTLAQLPVISNFKIFCLALRLLFDSNKNLIFFIENSKLTSATLAVTTTFYSLFLMILTPIIISYYLGSYLQNLGLATIFLSIFLSIIAFEYLIFNLCKSIKLRIPAKLQMSNMILLGPIFINLTQMLSILTLFVVIKNYRVGEIALDFKENLILNSLIVIVFSFMLTNLITGVKSGLKKIFDASDTLCTMVIAFLIGQSSLLIMAMYIIVKKLI